MRRILTILFILMVSTMLLACGSSGGSNDDGGIPVTNSPGVGGLGETVGVSCADVVADSGEPCDAELISNSPGVSSMSGIFRHAMAPIFDIGNAPSAVFLADDLFYNSPVINQIIIDNYTTSFQYFYVHRDYSKIIGCEALNKKSTSYRYMIQPMIIKDFGSFGVNFETCAEMNAKGSFITVALYNASHLADDELGDIGIDQVLFNTTIYFNLVNSPENP